MPLTFSHVINTYPLAPIVVSVSAPRRRTSGHRTRNVRNGCARSLPRAAGSLHAHAHAMRQRLAVRVCTTFVGRLLYAGDLRNEHGGTTSRSYMHPYSRHAILIATTW